MGSEQGGVFIVSYLLRHGASVFAVSSKGQPQFSRFFTPPYPLTI